MLTSSSGLFIYDEDSSFCYFNPYCFESSEQFFLVGILLGLAIYNSAILDVAFPPFAFKKLLASAPATNTPHTATPKVAPVYTLEDLAEIRPALAKGLRQLLEYDGDVEQTFCLDFVAQTDRYDETVSVPLCPSGERKPVTNSNRREYVELYIRYLLDTAVARQYEPFKRGFFTVCGGNALSLFRPEEIDLLIRGSDEPLDITALKAVAVYENWASNRPAEDEPQVRWFWQTFERANPKDQRKLLAFITGSDRIPAMGATNLVLKIVKMGGPPGRRHHDQAQNQHFSQHQIPPHQHRRQLSSQQRSNLHNRSRSGQGDLYPPQSTPNRHPSPVRNGTLNELHDEDVDPDDREGEIIKSEDRERLPSARTCFNMLGLWRYKDRAKLEDKLWLAVAGSEGFGLK